MRRTAQLLAGIALLSGCAEQPTASRTTDDIQLRAEVSHEKEAVEHRNLAALRAATVHFQRIEVAQAAGYDVQFPPGCFSSPTGAMGVHYLNKANVGTLEVTAPQFVMYEPQKNGTMKLVGVEYMVPGVPTDVPPVLFDRAFSYNATFGVWVLHVWAWRNNPLGLYNDWNPKVTCDFAATVSPISHH